MENYARCFVCGEGRAEFDVSGEGWCVNCLSSIQQIQADHGVEVEELGVEEIIL